MNQIPVSNCLHCGRVLEGVTRAAGVQETPKPGALSMCVFCAAVSAFDDDLNLRPLTQDEVLRIMSHPETVDLLRRETARIYGREAGKN